MAELIHTIDGSDDGSQLILWNRAKTYLAGAYLGNLCINVKVGLIGHVAHDGLFLFDARGSDMLKAKIWAGGHLGESLLDEGCEHNELIILVYHLTIQ